MCSKRNRKAVIFAVISFLCVQVYSQKVVSPDSLSGNIARSSLFKPDIHLSAGTSFTVFPHMGSVTGFTLSPSVFVQLSPRLSVEGGILAGHYFSSFSGFNPEGTSMRSYNELYLYGSTSYRVNTQLTIYGSGIRQITNNSPFLLPKSSYSIGSSYNFGSFSVGLTVHVTNWDNNPYSFPFSPGPGSFSPVWQGPLR